MAETVNKFKIRTYNEATQSWDYHYPETSGDQVKLESGGTVETHVTDTQIHVTTTEKNAWNAKEDSSKKGVANGYASLGADGKIPNSQIPPVAITDTVTASSQAAMLALTVQKGDVCVRTDLNKTFILKEEPATTLTNWQEMLTPTDTVLSVNGKTGAVNLTTSDIAEGTNKYYTEARVSANTDVVTAKNHAGSAHAPVNAQKNSDITKAEIEAKLTGLVDSHYHNNQIVITNNLASVTPREGLIVFEVI